MEPLVNCIVTSDLQEDVWSYDELTRFEPIIEETNLADYKINENDSPMLLAILTDEIIEKNRLRPVTSPILFEKNGEPNPAGLYSDEIFGTTPEEKSKTYAYIDLGDHFIHPYIHKVFIALQRNLDRLFSGEGAWKIEGGKMVECSEDDPEYNEDNTGITFFYNNYDKLIWESNSSFMRNERVKLLQNLKKEEIFITKWIVIPVFYRDFDKSGKVKKTPPINKLYNNLISYSNRLHQSTDTFWMHRTRSAIQKNLIEIREMGQSFLESKHGHIHKSVLGKSIIFSARSVITVPVSEGAQTPQNILVDVFHTGVPISIAAVTGFPFVARWIQEFFRKEFESNIPKPFDVKKPDGTVVREYKRLKDPLLTYTQEYIHKKIDQYINTYGARFEPVMVKTEDGIEVPMTFTGRGYTQNPQSPLAATISGRVLTWTDLLYMACADTLEDKHVYITRYPLSDYFGTFPSKVRIASTINTMPMMVNGKVYPYYPVVDPSLDQLTVSTLFNDTVTMANIFLKAMGGDYDGDQITVKMVYTEEANEEADKIMQSPKYFLDLNGGLIRVIGHEAVLTMYNMTL